MRFIVTAGWSIYPCGYFCGYLLGAVDETLLIVVYNVAGFVNKIAFVIACWSAAKAGRIALRARVRPAHCHRAYETTLQDAVPVGQKT